VSFEAFSTEFWPTRSPACPFSSPVESPGGCRPGKFCSNGFFHGLGFFSSLPSQPIPPFGHFLLMAFFLLVYVLLFIAPLSFEALDDQGVGTPSFMLFFPVTALLLDRWSKVHHTPRYFGEETSLVSLCRAVSAL